MNAKQDSYRVAQVRLSDLSVSGVDNNGTSDVKTTTQQVIQPSSSQQTHVSLLPDVHAMSDDVADTQNSATEVSDVRTGVSSESSISSPHSDEHEVEKTPVKLVQEVREILDPMVNGVLSINLVGTADDRANLSKEVPTDTTDIQALLARMEEAGTQSDVFAVKEAPPVPHVQKQERVQVIGDDVPDMWEVPTKPKQSVASNVQHTQALDSVTQTTKSSSVGGLAALHDMVTISADHATANQANHVFDLDVAIGQAPETIHARGLAETARTLGELTQAVHTDPAPGSIIPPQAHELPASHLASIRTFRSDVEDTITHKRTSVVDMIAAEQKRTAASSDGVVMVGKNSSLSLASMLLLGASIALVFAGGVIGVLFFIPNGQQSIVETPTFFVVEDGSSYVTNNKVRAEVMRDLVTLRDEVDVRLGAMSEIRVTKLLPAPDDDIEVPVKSQEFFALLTLGAPDSLVRSLAPAFMLGVHEFTGDQPFLIFTTTYYQNAFRGMLAWEYRMQEDLHPLFVAGDLGTQVITIPTTPPPTPVSTTTSTTTASTTSATTSQEVAVEIRKEFRQSGIFEDVVTDNVPARVLRDKNGEAVLLWSIPDGLHIIITTNEHSLREVRKRLSEPGF